MNNPSVQPPDFVLDHPIPASYQRATEPSPQSSKLEEEKREIVAKLASCAPRDVPVWASKLVAKQLEIDAGGAAEKSAVDDSGVAAKVRNKDNRLVCVSCGEAMSKGDAPHATVARIVRPNNRFGAGPGGAKAGDVVFVESRHISLAVDRATMSVAEFLSDFERRQKKMAEERATGGMLADMVDRGWEMAMQQTREQIQRGRDREEREAQRMVDEAKRAKAERLAAAEASREMVDDLSPDVAHEQGLRDRIEELERQLADKRT